MKTESAVKMIELCLQSINDHYELNRLMCLIVEKRIELATPKKREYKRKEKA